MIFFKLLEHQCPSHLLKLIMACYSFSSALIKVNSSYSTSFSTSCGVMQGNILSPTLYSFFINELILNVQASIAHHSPFLINIRVFADDILLLACSIFLLFQYFKSCQTVADKFHFVFNLLKCLLSMFDHGQTLGHKIRISDLSAFLQYLLSHQDCVINNITVIILQVLAKRYPNNSPPEFLIPVVDADHPSPYNIWQQQSPAILPFIKKFHSNSSIPFVNPLPFTTIRHTSNIALLEHQFSSHNFPITWNKQCLSWYCFFQPP